MFRVPLTTTQEAAPVSTYVRPADWLDIDSLVVDGDHKFVGLHAIFEYSNFISLSAQGAYTVDWGDGIIENYATGIQSYHQYDYYAAEFTGTDSTRGYRQAIVTVTPQAGQTLTNINLNKKHNQVGLSNYSSGWLDVKISGASISSLVIGGTVISSEILEQFSFIGLNAMTSTESMFYGCSSLSTVPLFDTSSVTDTYRMFHSCSSLSTVPLFDTSSVTDMDFVFGYCSSLSKIPLFNTISVTNMSRMFYSCSSLSSVPLFDTSSVTNMSNMFNLCSSLSSVPLFNTISVTNMYRLFYYCSSLSIVPLFDTSSVTNITGMLGNCSSLSRGTLTVITIQIDYSNAKLSAEAIVDIFNNLAIVAVATSITLTGNWGAALLTVAEKAIATDKGWTILE